MYTTRFRRTWETWPFLVALACLYARGKDYSCLTTQCGVGLRKRNKPVTPLSSGSACLLVTWQCQSSTFYPIRRAIQVSATSHWPRPQWRLFWQCWMLKVMFSSWYIKQVTWKKISKRENKQLTKTKVIEHVLIENVIHYFVYDAILFDFGIKLLNFFR